MTTRALSFLLLLVASCATDTPTDDGNLPGGGGKEDGVSQQIEVRARTGVAKLVANIACIESFNAENESTGARLYYHADSYAAARAILDTGLTTTFLGNGETCVPGGGTLPYAVVGPFDSTAKINAAIAAAGGYKEALVVFYNRDDLDAAFRAATTRALDRVE